MKLAEVQRLATDKVLERMNEPAAKRRTEMNSLAETVKERANKK